ncbi:unnamed protein product [Moneuplotes crassus]|uniref:Uncharacterized protein n=1 Tax=Euplotes crassus TaxID=5936 RepID=A0AAD1XC98_EUPCR|nr:unnamed protein product [Moneuplotes crassus]
MFSGFQTNSQEIVYNTLLFKMIHVLQHRIMLYEQGKIDQSEENSTKSNFKGLFSKIFLKLKGMEKLKSSPPMFSVGMTDLASYFGVFSTARFKRKFNKKAFLSVESDHRSEEDSSHRNSAISTMKNLDSIDLSQRNHIIQEDQELEEQDDAEITRKKTPSFKQKKSSALKGKTKNTRYSLNRNSQNQKY